VVFGLVFGALARGASWLSEKHARLVFLLLVFVPHVAHEFSGDVPSVVAGFVWFMDRLGTTAGFA
jgi:hypothetical protein